MNGVHDLGGMHDMGPIPLERGMPAFHANWERRMLGMMLAAMSGQRLNGDAFRFEIESLPPADYLRMSYFERWIPVLGALLVKNGSITPAELASGKAARRAGKAVKAAAPPVGRTPRSRREGAAAPRFTVGQQVRARNMNPVGHTRLPRYARGKLGTVVQDIGVAGFPDTHAHGQGDKPQHVYSVRFTARELWGDQAPPRDAVYIDLWDDYLESA
ncbi:MAG: nitrile hydratase subunit beta [Gemmatimonadota bacterium]